MNIPRYGLFLLGQVGMMSLTRYFFQWIIKYVSTENPASIGNEVSVTLFSAATVGAVLFGFRIFDGVTDPIIGGLSDTWVRKGRERRSILLAAFWLPAVGLVLCFLPDHAMPPTIRWVILIIGMSVFFIGYTIYAIPYWSLIEDYACGNPETRRHLSNLLGVGLLIATGIGFVVSPLVVDALGHGSGAIVFGVICSILMIMPFLAAPHGSARSALPDNGPNEKPSLPQMVLAAVRHKKFFAIIVLFAGSQMSLTIMTSAAPFIAEDLLGGTAADVAKLMGPLLVTAFLFFLVTPYLSRRFGWQNVLVVASIVLGFLYVSTGGIGISLVHSPMVTAALVFSAAGPMIAVLLGLEGEAITACANEKGDGQVSMYFGVYNFLVKAANGLAIYVAGIFAELSRASLGPTGIRFMAMSAGAFLFVGVVLYFFIRPKKA
jgi:glycoside/pentoside/hexuronide:cation symporter, GPH family